MESFKIDFPLLLGPTTVTLMPGFIGSLWLVFLNKENKAVQRLWLISFVALLLINIQTAAYHLPMNLDFMDLKYSGVEATSKLQSWIIFHWLRVGMAIVSAIYAIKAFKSTSLS